MNMDIIKKINKKIKNKGFTLIELLAVIVILAIVLVVTIPSIISSLNSARHSQLQNAADSIVDWLNKQRKISDLGLSMSDVSEEYISFFNDYCDGNVRTSYEEAKGCSLFNYNDKALLLLKAGGLANPEENIDLTRSYIWKSSDNFSIKLTALKGGSFYVNDGTPNFVISSTDDRVSINIKSLEDNADVDKIKGILEEITGNDIDELVGFTLDNLDVRTATDIANKISSYGANVRFLPDYFDDEYLENSDASYYSSIEAAVADANNGITNNGTVSIDSAVASVSIINNTITVSLLKNVDNVGALTIQRKMTLDLNGKSLSIIGNSVDNKMGIKIDNNVQLTINGITNNSSIRYSNNYNQNSNLFNISGDLIVNGGRYELISEGSNTNIFSYLTNGTSYNVSFNDCDIVINSPKSYFLSMNGNNTGSKVDFIDCNISINSDIPTFYSGKAKLGFQDCDIEVNMKSTTDAYLITNNNEMNINNVNFKINNDIVGGVVKGFMNNGSITADKFNLDIDNKQGKVYGIYSPSTLSINNSKIDIDSSNETIYGIYNSKNLNINTLEINTNNTNASSYSIYNVGTNGKADITGLTINGTGDKDTDLSSSKTITGIYNSGSSVTIRNSTIVSDSSCNNPETASGNKCVSSTGIRSTTGDLNLYNVNITSNDRGIEMSQSGKLFVSGGRYVGFGHGAIYFANGNGENYVQDAELISEKHDNYSGKYSTSDWTSTVTSCMYIGGGSESYHSNIVVHIDNSTIYDKASNYGYLVLRGGGAGEHDSSVYISNSTFRYDTSEKIRIDNSTHNLYLGRGNNINEAWSQKLPRIIGVSADTVHFTNEVYRK